MNNTIPIPFTRETAVDLLVNYRLANHDQDILAESFREGRIGYTEMTNEMLATIIYEEVLNNPQGVMVEVTGKEPEIWDTNHPAVAALVALYSFVLVQGVNITKKDGPTYDKIMAQAKHVLDRAGQ